MVKRKSFSFRLICVTLMFLLYGCNWFFRDEIIMVDSGINYVESTDVIINPGRGWHYPFEVLLPKESGSSPTGHLNSIAYYRGEYKIFQLRVNLVRFSEAGANAYLANHETQQTKISGLEGTTDAELTQAALDYLEQYLIAARTHKVGLIVRFGYLWPWYEIDLDIVVEPADFNLIMRHIEQLSDVLNKYPDVVLSIESGMIGQWGEQHSTKLALGWCGTCDRCLAGYLYNCRNLDSQGARQNFYEVIQKWLDCTREALPDVTVSVRTPPLFVWWYNLRYNTNYSTRDIDKIPETLPGKDEYRIGVWNDSYLADSTDSGTYSEREGSWSPIRSQSLTWLSKQARHTYFGGEYGFTRMEQGYGEISYFEYEAPLTHTTYLRGAVWGGALLDYWRSNTYMGQDPVYYSNTTEYRFVENRIGYRFVMRESKINSDPKPGGKLYLSGKIENVGFAPMLFSASASVLLVTDDTTVLEIPVKLDLNSDGLDIEILREYSISINLPQALKSGSYEVYLMFKSDKNNEPIALANIGMYNSTVNANKIGSIVL